MGPSAVLTQNMDDDERSASPTPCNSHRPSAGSLRKLPSASRAGRVINAFGDHDNKLCIDIHLKICQMSFFNGTPFSISTLVAIPTVMRLKYITNSRALLTGCLNLTIDKAPIIPSDKAIFPSIVLVIINVIKGKIINVISNKS